jgi:biotin-(acetyl-CoA carboxylase) ligase
VSAAHSRAASGALRRHGEGKRRRGAVVAGDQEEGRGRLGRPEVEDGPDRWAPPVSRREIEKREVGQLSWAMGN